MPKDAPTRSEQVAAYPISYPTDHASAENLNKHGSFLARAAYSKTVSGEIPPTRVRRPPARASITAVPVWRPLPSGWGSRSLGRYLIPDERAQIEERLRHWSDVERCELVLTTGGTGLSPTDVTPEATLAVIERAAPGIPEAMREASRAHTPHWMLARGVAGTRGSSLIVNFPGNPASIDQTGEAIAGALTHALALITGRASRH